MYIFTSPGVCAMSSYNTRQEIWSLSGFGVVARSLELKRLRGWEAGMLFDVFEDVKKSELPAQPPCLWKFILFISFLFCSFCRYFLLVVHQSDPLSRSSWIRATAATTRPATSPWRSQPRSRPRLLSLRLAIRVCPTAAAGGDYDLGQKWMLGYKWCGCVSVYFAVLSFEVLSLTLIPWIL